ncbi:MAG TPA: acyltransferase family protein [Streptosporangiaceae bacterium]|nr:acyltransferase family protein [Streptosporangiaceae bacterium]
MPKPVDTSQKYLPGLDGLRALAVLAVIAYHEQFGWAQGGLLGVGVFFTLSGFLITSLLIGQWAQQGKLALGDFWLRRARRLLPALFVMLTVVTAWVTVADRARLASLRGAVGAAAGYFSNWYLIANSQSYFARFAPPAPLDHLWSLAVEEQFYLIWPLLLIGALILLRKRGIAAARWLILPASALAVVSAIAMARLYQPGMDPTRVYEGTDTRAFGLLAGAVLALAWPRAGLAGPGRRIRLLLDGAGITGLMVIGVMIWRVGEYSAFGYRGGMVLLSVATAAVVAAAASAGSLLGRVLGWRPLRWIGARSYGIYLWHYPVIVLTTPPNATQDLPRAALQIAAAVLLAGLSWQLVEEPVRHGAIGRAWVSARALGGRSWLAGTAAARGARRGVSLPAAATAAVVGVLAVAGAGLTGVVSGLPGSGAGAVLAAGSARLPVTKTVLRATRKRHGRPRTPASVMPAPGAGGPQRTSCRSVAHIGDSTSDGLNSPQYLPNPRQRIVARYEDVGARTVITDIEGARSIVEVLPGGVNGYDAAKAIMRGGFRGCWVLALGTDDTADVAAGSNYSLTTRISRMMAVTRGEPVLWVNVKSLVSSGPYAEPNMRRWNAALLKACARYPNMRVYDWAAAARAKWFISDGIHYSSLGYEHRAKMIADALARAFPQDGQSSGCLVSS